MFISTASLFLDAVTVNMNVRVFINWHFKRLINAVKICCMLVIGYFDGFKITGVFTKGLLFTRDEIKPYSQIINAAVCFFLHFQANMQEPHMQMYI